MKLVQQTESNDPASLRYSRSERGKEMRRRRRYMKDYGITLEEYNERFAEQGGKCAICDLHQSELKNALAVDHDHETMVIRGLLCISCNSGIGKLGDNIEGLERALNYLREVTS